jgi:hypothetical protein
MAQQLPPLEGDVEVSAPLVARKGVDYARRAANRRAMWGDYEEDEQPEQWEGCVYTGLQQLACCSGRLAG